MKRIKEPKTFKRPRLYYQPANSEREMYRDKDQLSVYDTGRLRIIYPDGKAEWFSLQNDFTGDWWHDPEWEKPCWWSLCTSGYEALRQMKGFDAAQRGWGRAIFFGEL